MMRRNDRKQTWERQGLGYSEHGKSTCAARSVPRDIQNACDAQRGEHYLEAEAFDVSRQSPEQN